ncbi:MAG TPA: MBL fold metallo-hydrolase [Thermoguttaceae bacterium]|nr:MBL fold metallo-hydrolase [Thermoguttaceae bacterium]
MPTLPAVKQFVSSNAVRIYRIPCRVFEHLTARVYLLLGAGPPTLVDTGSGSGESTRDILAGLETVRTEFGEPVRPGDLRRIIITHGHVDHVGGLWELRQVTQADVAIHPLDCRAITAPDERAAVGKRRMLDFLKRAGLLPEESAQLVEQIGYRRRGRERIPAAIEITDERELEGLKFIHTPGHSPGHVCIAVGDVLLSADHILARTIPQLWPESLMPYTGLGHYLESLDKVRRIDGLNLALAGHEPVIHDLCGRIETIRASHERRLDRLLDIVRKSCRPLSISEISRTMYSTKRGFDAVLALTDVGARVEYLHQRGRLPAANLDEIETEENPVGRYCVV